jgi:hypothetical protein
MQRKPVASGNTIRIPEATLPSTVRPWSTVPRPSIEKTASTWNAPAISLNPTSCPLPVNSPALLLPAGEREQNFKVMSMDTAVTMFLIWLVHAAVGATLSAPIVWFGRKRIAWTNWELLTLTIPFCVWLLLMLSSLSYGGKSFANIGEPIYISFAMPLAAVLRVSIGQHLRPAMGALIAAALLCGIAVAIFFLVPMKPLR